MIAFDSDCRETSAFPPYRSKPKAESARVQSKSHSQHPTVDSIQKEHDGNIDILIFFVALVPAWF
jgi:hypothetical protein